MSSDKENVYIDVAVKCSSSTINQLILEGGAKHVLHVECSNTLFRHAYEFLESSKRISIPAESLNYAVEVRSHLALLKPFLNIELKCASKRA